jgi:hypothetical protein
VLSRCTPDMIVLGNTNDTADDIKYNKQNLGCSKITLNEKMRLATIDNVEYVKQSTLLNQIIYVHWQNTFLLFSDINHVMTVVYWQCYEDDGNIETLDNVT